MIKYLTILSLFNFLFSQGWYNHPELNWETIETEHFFVHFHDEARRSAQEAAAVAEKVYAPITSFYDYEPDTKTHIIIQDTDDIANGAAYYYDNKMIIWALPLDFELRGAHRWLNNVIAHEFTHIVQIGASMKFSRRFPASFFQIMSYEDEKREDVLYGYPNAILSYPVPGVSIPPWLAEGTAQFMYPDANYDFWDSHRDMIIRDRVMNNNLLSFNAMNSFGKRGIGNESIYNQGFLFSSWLCENYGVDILKKISQSLSKPINYSIDGVLFDITGKDGHELYSKWYKDLTLHYSSLIRNMENSKSNEKVLLSDGTTNLHPVWSPNQKKFSYLSNKHNDYFGQTDLFIYDFFDSTSVKIASGVHSAATWVDDSLIIYTKRSKPNKWGSRFFDLYKYDLIEEKEKRLTYNSRLISPVYNKNLNNIVAIATYDGTSNIMLADNINLDTDSLSFSKLTNFDNGIQLLSLCWHKNKLYVDGVYHQGRQIYELNLDSTKLVKLTSGKWENRDQNSSPNGLIFTTDRSGINNLIEMSNGKERYITNVTGGAFMPSISNDGKVLFSLYENGKYKIALIDKSEYFNNKNVGYGQNYFLDQPLSDLILGNNLQSGPYEEKMLSMSIFPKLMIDYNTIKPGLYFMGNEVIDRFSIFGGISSNNMFDMDIFLLLEYKKLLPTLYTNLFWISRHRDADRENPFLYPRVDGSDVDNIKIYNDLAFNLFSGDLGMRFALGLHKLKLQYNYSNYRQHVEQNVYQEFSYNNIDSVIWQYGEIGFDYFRGHSISMLYSLTMIKPSYVRHMLPSSGWSINANLSYEWNHFMDGFLVSEEYSTFGARFIPHNTARITIDTKSHYTIDKKNKIVASINGKFGGLSNNEVDDFFHFFGGGLPGLKGYTFYEETLTGPYYFIGTSVIRLPIFLEKNYTLAQFNFQNLSLGGIFQFGSAIQNSFSEIYENDIFKLSTGLEFRLKGFSFYSYPLAIAYEYHMPLSDLNEKGKHYFTLLFDY